MSVAQQHPRHRQVGRFWIGETIGTGSFSTVTLGTHVVTKFPVATKSLSLVEVVEKDAEKEPLSSKEPSSSKLLRLAAEEIANLRSCRGHPHILQLYCVIQEEADDDDSSTITQHHLVTEFVGGGDLYDYIASKQPHKLLPKQQANYFFQQISSAVMFLHSKQIAHRDLSLSNILLDPSHQILKIADFGLSKHYCRGDDEDERSRMVTACGSPYYAAPEIVSQTSYTELVDVWSCGVILYVLLCGTLPFLEQDPKCLMESIQSGIYPRPLYIMPQERDLIQTMLQVDPTKRATMNEICDFRTRKLAKFSPEHSNL